MGEAVAGGGGDLLKGFSSQFRGGIWELDPCSAKKENDDVLGSCGKGLGVEVTRVAVMEQLWWHLEPSWGHPTTAAAEEGLEGQFHSPAVSPAPPVA